VAAAVNAASQVARKSEDDAEEIANAASQMSSALLRIGALCDFMDVTEGNSERAYPAPSSSGGRVRRPGANGGRLWTSVLGYPRRGRVQFVEVALQAVPLLLASLNMDNVQAVRRGAAWHGVGA